MKLKEFLDKTAKENPMHIINMAVKVLELEALTQYFALMYGVDLEIEIKPIKRPTGRWYGKGVVEELDKLTK